MADYIVDYFYKVKSVVKVVDGDTVDLEVDLGFGVVITHRFRLVNFDAPEIYRPKDEQEKLLGLRCKDYLNGYLLAHIRNLYVKSYKSDVYGRYLAEIFYKDSDGNITNVNTMMNEFLNKIKQEVIG